MDFIEEKENYIQRNLLKPEDFKSDSFEEIPFFMGISMLVGQLSNPDLIQNAINPDKKEIMAVRFDKPQWDLQSALAWLKENVKKFDINSVIKKQYGQTHELKGVEVFSTGIWNGDKYTKADLENMVSAFNEHKKGFLPPLKVGHDNDQKILQESGMPAAGYINKLYINGEKLMADIVDIPKKVFELIKDGAWRRVSSEIIWNFKTNGKVYPKFFTGLALLGAEIPGVMNLKDLKTIASQYKLNFQNNENDYIIKTYFNTDKGSEMPETNQELLDAQKKIEELEAKVKNFEANTDEQKDELEELRAFKKDAEAKALAQEQELKETKLSAFCSDLEKEGLITPAVKPLLVEFLKEDKKEYSFKDGDKETKYTKEELLKQCFSLLKKVEDVNTEEKTYMGKKPEKGMAALENKINEYMKEHKVSYRKAYAAVTKDADYLGLDK